MDTNKIIEQAEIIGCTSSKQIKSVIAEIENMQEFKDYNIFRLIAIIQELTLLGFSLSHIKHSVYLLVSGKEENKTMKLLFQNRMKNILNFEKELLKRC